MTPKAATAVGFSGATLTKLLNKLLPTTSKQRAGMKGLDDQRKDQITAGVLLTHTIFEKLNLQEMQICGSALREGIMLDYLARHVPELSIRRQVPDPRRRSILDLARRCDWHETHSLQVARLCMSLFDQTRQLHGLGKAERELIEYGTLLHDIGWHISREGHHKHAMYLIEHGNLKGFTEEGDRHHRQHRPLPPRPAAAARSQGLHRPTRQGPQGGERRRPPCSASPTGWIAATPAWFRRCG